MPLRVVLATANPHKVSEITDMLAGSFQVLPRPSSVPEVDETEDTLEGNARVKARAVMTATGEAAVADDTGLEVEALDGRPGVWSARYAGEDATYADNVAKLLGELAALPPGTSRRACFRTVALAAFPDGGPEVMAEGVVDGEIADAPRGEGGFGYDSVFVPDDGDGRTFAEMTPEEKAEISHRGRAFRSLATGIVAVMSSLWA